MARRQMTPTATSVRAMQSTRRRAPRRAGRARLCGKHDVDANRVVQRNGQPVLRPVTPRGAE
eukprot:1458750-Rhodomonas_salina.1